MTYQCDHVAVSRLRIPVMSQLTLPQGEENLSVASGRLNTACALCFDGSCDTTHALAFDLVLAKLNMSFKIFFF